MVSWDSSPESTGDTESSTESKRIGVSSTGSIGSSLGAERGNLRRERCGMSTSVRTAARQLGTGQNNSKIAAGGRAGTHSAVCDRLVEFCRRREGGLLTKVCASRVDLVWFVLVANQIRSNGEIELDGSCDRDINRVTTWLFVQICPPEHCQPRTALLLRRRENAHDI